MHIYIPHKPCLDRALFGPPSLEFATEANDATLRGNFVTILKCGHLGSFRRDGFPNFPKLQKVTKIDLKVIRAKHNTAT